MNTQPEALRLADELVSEFVQGCISNNNGLKAAAELRRLHEVNQMLAEALEITVPYLPAKTAPLKEIEYALAKAKEQT